MFDRRSFLTGSTAVVLLGSRAAAFQGVTARDRKLDALLLSWFNADLQEDPALATSLGLDTGKNAHLRSKLADASSARASKIRAQSVARARQLRAFGRNGLSPDGQINYDVAEFGWSVQAEKAKFRYGSARGAASPYVVSQLGGSYYSVPDFLGSQHPIANRHDAQAYLARIGEFGRVLVEEADRIREDAAAGAVPPDFVIDKTIGNLKGILGTSASQSPLVRALATKTAEKGIAGDWEAQAIRLVSGSIAAGLNRQVLELQRIRSRAVNVPGVWRLPSGDAYYAHGLRVYTTTSAGAEEIHRIGLQQVADLQSRIDVLLRKQGYTKGSVGERLNAMKSEPRFLLPNTTEGRNELLALAQRQIAQMEPLLPRAFSTIPKAKIEVRRVPEAIEAGAPFAYYDRPSPDGTRPGVYWINLRDMTEWPTHRLPSLTHHEGVPGHHLQIATALEAGELPIYRSTQWFPAYGEGWGVYSERVADELGIYEDDPFGRIGHLKFYLFRAVRLVVDTGLNHKRWGRDQAIRYMIETAAEPEGNAIREVERYGVWPGQACSYKMGEIVISRLRAEAERKLGARFDIRKFHDAVLGAGPLPMTVLERRIRNVVT